MELSERLKIEVEDLFNVKTAIEWAENLNRLGSIIDDDYSIEEIKDLLRLQEFFLNVAKEDQIGQKEKR